MLVTPQGYIPRLSKHDTFLIFRFLRFGGKELIGKNNNFEVLDDR